MEFNSYVFPVPKASYTCEDFQGELIWIPKKEHFTYKDKIKYTNYKNSNSIRKSMSSIDFNLNGSKSHRRYSSTSMIQKIPSISFSFDNKFSKDLVSNTTSYIPCLFLRVPDYGSNKIIIYFHANYEDLGSTYQICSAISKCTKMNVLSVEYPSYGIYKSDKDCNSDIILEDAEIIYKFLTEIMGIEENMIVSMGRCIGSGPATYLAAKHSPASLILISPFKSIKAAVKSIFDKMKFGWILEKFVKERFSNIDLIQSVKCPILFIHGKEDEVIPWQHSLDLINKCNCAAKLVTPENMKHNFFNLGRDILSHMKEFLLLFFEDDKFFNKKGKEKEKEKDNYIDLNMDEDEDVELNNVINFPTFMYKEPKL